MTAPERAQWRTGKKVKQIHLFINESWVEDAICSQADPEVFHPEKGKSAAAAIRVCFTCPVRLECLDYAMRHNASGVWGGKSENQRKLMRQRLRRAQ